MQAGDLRDRIIFEKRGDPVDDGYGNKNAGPFAPVFERWANFRFRAGGEAALAARLAGQQPLSITVRQDSQTRTAATDWRIKDKRTERYYNIRSIMDPDPKSRAWIEFMCDGGVAETQIAT